jgi:deazaflavin-dependent oxidoreductase (nitroreductase family)
MTTTPRPVQVERVSPLMDLGNRIVRRLIAAGLPLGPNVLLTVRGRSSGIDRTFPVALIEHRGRRFIQSPYGEVNWVRNLRASRSALITKGRTREAVDAVELAPDEAGPILRDALAPYLRSRLLRPLVRLFIGVRVDSTLDDYVDTARRHPTFELKGRGQM